MKKAALVSTITSLSLLFGGANAFAAQAVSCTTSGPNSPCTVKVSNQNELNCNVENNVNINNNNEQNTTSGNASSGNNTSSGNVTSGNSSANNSTYTGVMIDNSCVAGEVAVVTPTPTPTPTTTPAKTTSTPAVKSASTVATVKSLPDTGSSAPALLAIGVMLTAAGAVVASKFGATALATRLSK